MLTCISSVQSLSHVRLFVTPWITARQASLSIINSQSILKLMPSELVMPSSHLILCRPLLHLPPIPASIRVFSNESTLHMRWPKYWSFSFSISPSKDTIKVCILLNYDLNFPWNNKKKVINIDWALPVGQAVVTYLHSHNFPSGLLY